MSKSILFRVRGTVAFQCRNERRLPASCFFSVDRDSGVTTPASPPTPSIARLVDRNPVNPGTQIRVAAKVNDALKRAKECFLCQVASLFAVFRQAIEQTVN